MHLQSAERRTGFTLIEMLVVISIVGLLAYLLLPALPSLSGAQSVNQAIYDVSSILQLARSEAVSRQSYVWVGFSQGTNNGGRPELTMAAASSMDGSTNYASANLVNLTRPVRVDGVVLKSWSTLKPATQALFTTPTVSVSGGSGASVSFPSQAQAFTDTITFTPRGEAMLTPAPTPDDPYQSFIDVSFRQSNTSTPAANANDASIVLDGGTGAVQTIRLQ